MTVKFSKQHRLDLELVVGIVLIPEFSLKKKRTIRVALFIFKINAYYLVGFPGQQQS